MGTLIRHGIVVTPEGAAVRDVLVEGERIAQVGPRLAASADRTVDATGKYVIPGGAPGIETRMSLLYDGGVVGGRFGVERFVELTATGPATLFGLYPRKGTIAPGSDADLVIWDPHRTHPISAATHHMRVDYSAYEGRVVKGAPDVVFVRGEPVVEGGAFVGRQGTGRFLRRAPR